MAEKTKNVTAAMIVNFDMYFNFLYNVPISVDTFKFGLP